MSEKEIYHLDIVVDVKGDESSKQKMSALDRYFEQTQKRANILNKMSVSPSAKINDRATSRIDKINATLNKLNKLVASPTVMIKDKVSGSLNIIKGGINKVISAATSLEGALLGVGSAWAGVIKPMQLSGDFEQTQMAFTTMLKSADKANSFLLQAQNMANQTPFEFPELADTSKKLLAFGWNVKSILPDLTTIGDTASGLSLGAEGINQISLALGQMKAKGRVQGDEMLQLTEAGVPAAKILQEQLGLTADQVANIGDAGISADKAINALLTGMNQRFGGMMQNQAKTALGLMSTLKDTFENKLLTQWGNGLWSGIKPGLMKVTDWLDKNDKKVTELGGLFKKAGENVSTFIGGSLEKSQQRLSKLMDSSQWKNADLGGKITLAWDKIIAEPLSSWWSGSGRPKVDKVASDIGSGIGSVLGGGIIAVLDAFSGGDDINKTGNTAGKSFLDAFLKAFNTDEIIKKLLTSFKNTNLDAIKNPSAESITKAGILDYGLYAVGAGTLIKGGTKAAKGVFKLGKWAVGKKGAETAASAAEEMAGVAGSASKASSTSSKASNPFSEEINRLKANIEDAKKGVINSSKDVKNKQKSYTTARDTFKEVRNTKTSSELSKAASAFRKAADESKAAEQLRKSSQEKLNQAIKNYDNLIKKSQNVGKGKNVPESLSKQISTAQTKVDNARKKVRSAGINESAKKEAYNNARDTFKSAKDVGNTSDLKKAAADFRKAVNDSTNAEKLRKTNQDKLNKAVKEYNDFVKKSKDVKVVGKEVSEGTFAGIFGKVGKLTEKVPLLGKVGKVAQKVPLLGAGLTLAGAGIDIATASDKKKATVGAAGNIAGGLVGMKAGATIGGTIGSIFGPVGTAVGAGVGGIAGGIAGSIGGEKALDWIYDKTGPAVKYLKSGFDDTKKSVQTSWNGLGKWFDSNVSTPVSSGFNNAKKSIENKWSNTKTWFNNSVGTPFKDGAINAMNFTVGAFAMGKDAATKAWAPYGQWLSNNVFTPIKNKASEAGKWAGDKLGEGKTWAANKWSGFSSWWNSNVSTPVRNDASSDELWISQKYGEAKTWVVTKWSDFSTWWGINVSGPVKGYASDAGIWIAEKYSQAKQGASDAWVGFSGWWSKNIAEPTKSIATDVGSWIGQKLSAARATADSAWSDFSDWFAKHISGPVEDFIKEAEKRGEQITGKSPSDSKDSSKTVKKKANGGIVNGPEFSLIGEAGTEAVIPLSSSRRSRGVQLWQQAGKMLGVSMFADGGIVGSGSTGTGKVTKATASISTSIALGDDALAQFKKYGNKINDNLSSGILDNKKVSTDSVNKITNESGSILNLFSKTGHVYGSATMNDFAQGISAATSNVTSAVKTLSEKVIEQFKTEFGIHSPSSVMRSLAGHIPEGFILGLKGTDMAAFIKKWIGDTSSLTQNGMGSIIGQILQPMFSTGDNKGIIGMIYSMLHGGEGLSGLFSGGAVSGSLSGWITAAMALTGVSSDWLGPLATLIQHESGGDPMSINLWDSNAAAGHPSKGLMQLIDENMQDWHLPGMDNIYDPVSNIAAGIRLILHDYGSIYNVPGIKALASGGSYVGYATGTDNARKGLARINERGWEFVDFTGGEQVLTHNKSVSLMERTANSINRIKNAVSGLNSTDTENKDIPENLSYYTSQPQVAMAGSSYGDINIENNFDVDSDPDIEAIVIQVTKKFATELRKTLQNLKR